MNGNAKILTALVGYEALGTPIEKESLFLSDEALARVYEIANKHDLAHLVSAALDRLGAFPEGELGEKIRRSQMLAVQRCVLIDHEYSRICKALNEGKICFIPLKGSIIKNLYRERWHRTSCDIDILVKENNLDEAIQLLCDTLGYKTDGVKNFHDISLRSKSGVHLELHFNIKENLDYLDVCLDRVWDYAKPVTEGGYQYKLSAEFFMYHLFAHLTNHFVRGGCGVRPFLDICVLKEKAVYDEEKLRELLRVSGIERFCDAACRLAEIWFMSEEPDDLSAELERYVLCGGAYGSIENRVSVNREKEGGKFKYIIKRIFMPYKSLKLLYPILNKHKWLLPICWVRRWFRILFNGRLKSSVSELKAINYVSDDKVKSVDSLFRRLELNK